MAVLFLASFAYAGSFSLLSDQKEGVIFLKDPCYKNKLSLIFSFNQDIQDVDLTKFNMVDFSKGFREELAAEGEGIMYIYLEAAHHEKISEHQLKIDYWLKKISEDGINPDLETPDQIEIVILNQDLAKVKSLSNESSTALTDSEKVKTLINTNTDFSCFK